MIMQDLYDLAPRTSCRTYHWLGQRFDEQAAQFDCHSGRHLSLEHQHPGPKCGVKALISSV